MDKDLTAALGVAVYAFARLEWGIAWCCEEIEPGRLRSFSKKQQTAGGISKIAGHLARQGRLLKPTRVMPVELRQDFLRCAKVFDDLVYTRNQILHAKPCTGPDGRQLLSSSQIWTPEAVLDFAERVATLDRSTNGVLYALRAMNSK